LPFRLAGGLLLLLRGYLRAGRRFGRDYLSTNWSSADSALCVRECHSNVVKGASPATWIGYRQAAGQL